MTNLAGPLLAALVLIGQAGAGRSITGTAVGPDGKPVAGAEVVLSCGMAPDGTVPSLETVQTDKDGRFGLVVPRRERLRELGWYGSVWAYRPGSALAVKDVLLMQSIDQAPVTLVLRATAPRTVALRGGDGKPIAGARVRLSSIHGAASNFALHMLPDDLALRFSAATGQDGKATFAGLSPRDDMMAVRIDVDALGAQDVELTKQLSFGKDAPAEYAVALNPPVPIAGRVVDGSGKPVAGVPVEVWTRGNSWNSPTPMALPGGPLRTTADGSFQSPAGLQIGVLYRLVIRSPGNEPILSAWTTAVERPPRMPDLVLRPLRAIAGRVVDRQGRPVAGVEVFQAGDGPETTSARTDDQGRFSLAGFRQGPVLLFARGGGMRFHGQLVKDDVAQVDVVLTRQAEEPARSMATLPDPIPPEESRELARKVLQPCLESAVASGDDSARYWALQAMVKIDSAAVLERLDSIRFHSPASRDTVKNRLVIALAATDPEEAAAVAESIADPGTRAGVLVDLADALPDAERRRKLSVLDQAALQVGAATRIQDKLFQMGEVAERWYELGEVERARALFADGRTLAGQLADKSDPMLGYFAVRLSRVDVPGALRIVQAMTRKESVEFALGNIAGRIAADDPAEAERILERIDDPLGRLSGTYRACQKMAAVDPTRARRIAEKTQGTIYRADALLFLAVGLKGREPRAASEALRAAVGELDRYLADESDDPFRGRQVAEALPLVEQIDPTMVPEVFWRAVAARPSVGDPRKSYDYPSIRLLPFLARYDREVAAALFRPSRAELDQTSDPGTSFYTQFLAWSLIDPRGAAARLTAIGPSRQPDANANWTITGVAECLARSGEARWRWVWSRLSWVGGAMFDRDVR